MDKQPTKAGQIVAFANPLPEDGNYEMVTVWVDFPRAMVQINVPDMAIKPTKIVNVSDLVCAS